MDEEIAQLENIMKMKAVTVISFISLVFFIIGLPALLLKYSRIIIKLFSKNIAQSIVFIFIIIFSGIVAPIILIFKSFDWSGWQFWLTQISSWYALFSFIVLVYMVIKFNKIIGEK